MVSAKLVGLLGQGHDERPAVEGQLLEIVLEGRPNFLARRHGDALVRALSDKNYFVTEG